MSLLGVEVSSLSRKEIVMATIVAGNIYEKLDGQLFEIKRQIRQQNGYPYDPEKLLRHLQKAIEGEFSEESNQIVEMQPTPRFQFDCPFNAAETNLDEIIPVTEHWAKKVLGVTVNLRKQFDIPAQLPWKSVLLVFDPKLNNRQAVQKSLKDQKLSVYEESNAMEYSGSEASSQPTLQIIENSITPTQDTMKMSPDQLDADGRPYLALRRYALAFSLRYFGFKSYLDSNTCTWFPKNRLPGGGVAHGRWDPHPGFRKVWFCWSSSGRSFPDIGARLAMPVSPKS